MKEYWIYWDGDKPYESHSLKKIFVMTKKPSDKTLYNARINNFRPNLTVKKIRIEVIDDK